jgi:predicted amidophosphoribosyltransferase
MIHCPICGARLNSAETCRRCRTELKRVQDVERQGRELAGAAMHLLALGNTAGAMGLLRRACVVHAAREVRLLSMMVARPRHSPASQAIPIIHRGERVT